MSLEDEFANAMMDTYRTIRAEVYNPALFFKMIAEHGALSAARILLQGPDVSDGFTRLYLAGKLHLTVEAVVLHPKWKSLFSEAELTTARERLARYGYQIPDSGVGDATAENPRWPTVRDIAATINEKAGKYRFGALQKLRKELKGLQKTHSVLFDLDTEWVARDEYAYHLGGRQELQYNVGYEEVDGVKVFRHGVAFSLEKSQRALDVVENLLPKISRFNEFVAIHPDKYRHLTMWYWSNKRWGGEFPLTRITADLAAPENFIMIGRRTSSPLVDVDLVLRDFDELLPLYQFVESSGRAVFPSVDRSISGLYFHPGHRPAVTNTTRTSAPERVLAIELWHNEIQTKLYNFLVAEFGANAVGTEQLNGPGNRVDVVVRFGRSHVYYEIKTYSSGRACLREALSQLLEYSYWPSSQEAERLVVVGTNPATPEEEAYLETLRARLRIPVYYEWFDEFENRLRTDSPPSR
ncbi:MAG TPA: hypothetical protein VFJ82_05670 [Longimicrobium sp.]|nr:hypothetical protein [Longimicrobium sp.]